MANDRRALSEHDKEVRVMEVFYIEPEKKLLHIDYFTKEDQVEIIENFFIKGGLPIPPNIDDRKTMDQLNEEDYTKFFIELGYEVTGFTTYDKNQHQAYSVHWPGIKDDEDIEELEV